MKGKDNPLNYEAISPNGENGLLSEKQVAGSIVRDTPGCRGEKGDSGNVPKVLQISKNSKERGECFPPHPPRISATGGAAPHTWQSLELFYLHNFAHAIFDTNF